MNKFEDLGLAEPILRAVRAEGYETPTPIQAQAIPLLLKDRDLLGIAQTGTGKTAAFGLPLLQKLAATKVALQPQSVRALILAPTRELAIQIDESLRVYGRHLHLRHGIAIHGWRSHAARGHWRPAVQHIVVRVIEGIGARLRDRLLRRRRRNERGNNESGAQ